MERIDIPFLINPYEEALVNVLSQIQLLYNTTHRFRTITEENNRDTYHQITGYVTIEKWNADNNTWEEEKRSPTFTVKSDKLANIDNSGYAKSMIKFLYFACKSLGVEIDMHFQRETIGEVLQKYGPKVKWEDEMKKNGIEVLDFSKHNNTTELRKFFEQKGLLELFWVLQSEVKAKYKAEKPSGRMYREYVYGKKVAQAAKMITEPKRAKRTDGTTPEKPKHPAPALQIIDENGNAKRNGGAVLSLFRKLDGKGVNKGNYAEKMPDMAAKYPTLTLFVQNATHKEVEECLSR